jgi:tetratricopeptide (TPR) repeat protein
VVALLGADCLPDDLVERIVDRSDGNPLFIEELFRTWVSIGTLVEEGSGGYTLVDPERTVDLPATVQAIYAGQLDDLPPDARLLARRASVAGRRFPVDALPALEAMAGEALDALHIRRLVDGPLAAHLGPSYAYRHALLRDAGYGTLARVERARLHARLAAWMIEAAGHRVDPVAEGIARHYESAVAELPALVSVDAGLDRATLAATAAGWLERAGTVALQASAQATARDLLRRAIELTPADASVARASRLALLGEATAFSGDMDAGITAYREAADTFRQVLDGEDPALAVEARDGYASAILGEGTLLVEQLQFHEAEARADEALEIIGRADDLATARLRYLRAWAQVAYQPREESADDARAALAVAERDGDPRLRLEALHLLQGIMAETGEITREELHAGDEELARLALEIGSTRRAVAALRLRGLDEAETDPAAGAPWISRSLELAEAHGLLEDRAWGAYARCEIDFVRGDWGGATRSALAALEIAEANAYHRTVVRTLMILSPMALARGQVDLLERARGWLDPRRADFPDSPFGRFMHTAMDLRFAAAGLIPPFTPGVDLLDAWDESPGLPSWQAATWTNVGAWIDGGQLETATKALERIDHWQAHAFATPLAAAVAEALRSRLELARGQAAAAVDSAERGARTALRLDAPWALALAERARGAALASLGNEAAAAAANAVAERAEASLGLTVRDELASDASASR